MSIIRVARHERYIALEITCLNDPRLSFRAKGIHAFLCSKPDGWTISIKHLATVSTEKRDAIAAAMQELLRAGYARRERRRDPLTGRMSGYDTVVYEYPTDPPIPGKPTSENPHFHEGGATPSLAGTSSSANELQELPTVKPPSGFQGPDSPTSDSPTSVNPPLVINEGRGITEKEKEDSLASLESPCPTVPVAQPPAASPPAPPGKKSKARPKPTPLQADDWLRALLLDYQEEFPFDVFNDDAWWTDIANSFPVFNKEWVSRAFADLSGWLRANKPRTPRSAQGWHGRMNFSLNYFYDKDQRRLAYARQTTRR